MIQTDKRNAKICWKTLLTSRFKISLSRMKTTFDPFSMIVSNSFHHSNVRGLMRSTISKLWRERSRNGEGVKKEKWRAGKKDRKVERGAG